MEEHVVLFICLNPETPMGKKINLNCLIQKCRFLCWNKVMAVSGVDSAEGLSETCFAEFSVGIADRNCACLQRFFNLSFKLY